VILAVSPTIIQSKEDVKRAWERINIDYLQPNKCLEKKIYIEVNNDNDSRFSAKRSVNLQEPS
jgi:hypothetical protein